MQLLQQRSLLECRRITPHESVLVRKGFYSRCACCELGSDWALQPWTVQTTINQVHWNDRALCSKHGEEAIAAGVPKRSVLLESETEESIAVPVKLTEPEKMLELIRRSGGGTPSQVRAWASRNGVRVSRVCLYRAADSKTTRDRVRVEGTGQKKAYFYVEQEDAAC